MLLYPMTFREFAAAVNQNNLIELFSDWPVDRAVPDPYAQAMKRLLLQNCIVGGMPEVVQTWIDENSYEAVDQLQNEILRDYEDDFSKYASISDIPKIRLTWNSVPVQLGMKNNKFVFSHVKSGARAAQFEDALQWLRDAGLIYQLYKVVTPQIPLSSAADITYFKVYMSDIGLLRCRSGLSAAAVMQGKADFVRYKGAFAENYVYTELPAQNKKPYFWRSGNTAEADFLFEYNNGIVPVEVKAADHTQAKSYRLYCQRYVPAEGLRLSMKNISDNMCEKTRTISLPLYLAWNMDHYL